ncbi:translation initiation factor IF-1 [Metamycoplasma subdolum]|uniref:Translation initiation factor IF-1 n=1 Tax=Metamycoplasma subdolum TaxID=92407 RepID=A0A3M0A1T1_9BACT|nr:translation initiation factor IF-1 [Metamycoplasma subdolum]RMA78596.1 translation initiation factor IF-1 [Metamycoplasma subdolum]WPB50268.1 translation initiation factor IF-1 [Metamycoplasma subdolum]
MAKDAIKMSGKIVKKFSTKDYEVLLENGLTIRAFTSGKMTLHNIGMLPGDEVDVELSPYDMTKGRIIYRHK